MIQAKEQVKSEISDKRKKQLYKSVCCSLSVLEDEMAFDQESRWHFRLAFAHIYRAIWGEYPEEIGKCMGQPMNGLEALQALKDGYTVRYIRDKDGNRSDEDTLFRYTNEYNSDPLDCLEHLYCKLELEKCWHPCSGHSISFWLKRDNFEIEEEKE